MDSLAELGFRDYTDWRPYQWQTVQRIWESPKRLVVLSAPTGSGKSLIALALARLALEKSWYTTILTKDHALQRQYVEYEFADSLNPLMAIGRRNFECWHPDAMPGTTADQAPCVSAGSDPEFHKYPLCPFYVQRDAASKHPIRVLNYPFYIYEKLLGLFNTDLLICDEGHNVDQEILNTAKVELTPWNMRALSRIGVRIPVPEHSLLSQNKVLVGTLRYAVGVLEDVEYKGRADKDLIGKLKGILAMYEQGKTVIIENDFSFSPILSEQFATRLTAGAKKIVLMSATIFDVGFWADRLAIPLEEAEYIDLPSAFPRNRRPIYYQPVAKLGRNSSVEDWQRVITALNITIKRHQWDKGVVHTGSKARTEMFLAQCDARPGKLIGHWDNKDLERFKLAETTKERGGPVLISHRALEGVDLPDEMCRFIVFPKVPYPDRSSPVVRAQDAEMPGWYDHTTMAALIQGCGRGMRSADDYCASYIFDKNFAWLRSKVEKSVGMPRWFAEAIIV